MSYRTSKPKRKTPSRAIAQSSKPAISTIEAPINVISRSHLASASHDTSDLHALSAFLGTTPAPAPAASHETPSFIAGPGARTLQPPISLAQLFAESHTHPAPTWPIHDLLPTGLCLLAAKPHSGARTLALQLALAISRGSQALAHFPADSGEALYLGLHETRHLILTRTHHLLADEPLPTQLSWANTWQDWQHDGLADLQEWLTAHPHTRLLVIDSLSNILPPGTSTRQAHALLRQLNHLAHTHHLCILLLHSLARFSSHDPFNAIPCSPLLLEACETLAVLEHDRASSQATLHLTGHALSTRALPLVQEPASGRWSLDTTPAQPASAPEPSLQVSSFLDLMKPFLSHDELASRDDLTSTHNPTTQIGASSVTPTFSTSLPGGGKPLPSTSNTPCNAPSFITLTTDDLSEELTLTSTKG